MNLQFTHYLTLPVGFFGEPDVNLRELNSSEISCLLNLSEFLKKCALLISDQKTTNPKYDFSRPEMIWDKKYVTSIKNAGSLCSLLNKKLYIL